MRFIPIEEKAIMKGTKSTKPLKQLKLSVPAQETPITNFL